MRKDDALTERNEYLDKPFRWDVTRQKSLGNLLEGDQAEAYADFESDLLACCSRIVAFAGDSELVFIGRSPESVFDYLSGLFYDTRWFERLILLHLSMRFRPESAIRKAFPHAVPALRAYFESLDLHPRGLIQRDRPVALIDLVDSGDTFGRVVSFLASWSQEDGCHWDAVRAKIRLVGLTLRSKTSPKTWRWQQHADWIELLGMAAVKNVSLPPELWYYIGNVQSKVSRSYPPEHWGDPGAAVPSYQPDQLQALRLAHALFKSGRQPASRQALTRLLVKEPAMDQPWFRQLVLDLRR